MLRNVCQPVDVLHGRAYRSCDLHAVVPQLPPISTWEHWHARTYVDSVFYNADKGIRKVGNLLKCRILKHIILPLFRVSGSIFSRHVQSLLRSSNFIWTSKLKVMNK